MAQPNKAELAVARALKRDGFLIVRSFKQFRIGDKSRHIEWAWDGDVMRLDAVKIIGDATWEEFEAQALACNFGSQKGPFYYRVVEA